MNPALILALLQTVVNLGATLTNKPKAASQINGALTMISNLQVNLSQIGQALQASRREDGSIDEAGWAAVHAYLDSQRARLEAALGITPGG